jgi:hypothetical protein
MADLPLFWDSRFAGSNNCSLAEITISSKRKFRLNFQVEGDYFLIPGRLTYGGFFPLDNDSVGMDELLELMEILRSNYMSGLKIKWKLPPEYLFPKVFCFQNELSNLEDLNEILDFNQHINILDWSIQKMSKGNQKKLRQSVSAKMELKKATIEDILKCYDILFQNRLAIGVQVTMKLSEIQRAMTDFPNIYKIHYLELDEAIVAMCLTVDIAPKVRYVLYWADNLSFRNYSPITLLCERLIEDSLLEDIQILDLGISSEGGSLNEGLYRFKQNLGADSSHKRTIFSV